MGSCKFECSWRLHPRLIAMEASGGYESIVAATLAEASQPAAVVNPRQVRELAGAIGRLAKTDAIDASVIAHFADAIRPAPKPVPDELMLRLRELLARYRQPVVMINAGKQRLAKAADKLAQHSFKTILRSFETERARIAIQAAAGVLLLSFGSGLLTIVSGCMLFSLGVGNSFTLPLIAQAEFDAADVGTIVALVTAINQALFGLAPPIFGFLHDATASYAGPFTLGWTLEIVALLTVAYLRDGVMIAIGDCEACRIQKNGRAVAFAGRRAMKRPAASWEVSFAIAACVSGRLDLPSSPCFMWPKRTCNLPREALSRMSHPPVFSGSSAGSAAPRCFSAATIDAASAP